MTNNVQILLPLLEKTFCENDWQALKVIIENREANKSDLVNYYTDKLLKHFKINKPCRSANQTQG